MMKSENVIPGLGPTVYGIEQEYTVTATIGDDELTYEIVGECHSPDTKLGLFQTPSQGSLGDVTNFQYQKAIESLGLYKNVFGMLSNGGRFYIDPSGPEYCTPETETASEAVLRTFDGDRIMFGILHYLQTNDVIKSFQLNRRIVDHNGTSRGVHINTATSHGHEPSEQLVESLSALNVAKGALFGSGGLLVDRQGHTEFHHSPRLSITNHSGKSPASYTERTLVRQPFQEDVACRRIETTSSDALNFAWPLRASMVITNNLVKLSEMDEYKGKLPRLYRPVDAARKVGHLGNGTVIEIIDRFETKNVRPSEIISRIAMLAIEANEKFGHLDVESVQVLGEIIETTQLVKGDPANVIQRVESIARYEFMKRKMDEHKVGWDSTKLCQYDYYWDKIGGGVAESLRDKKGWGWHGFGAPDTLAKSKKRLAKPPLGTRAEVRGRLIHESKGVNGSTWYDFELNDESRHNVALHPLATELPNLNDLQNI